MIDRRAFLRWLLQGAAISTYGFPSFGGVHDKYEEKIIPTANEALTVFDFEPLAQKMLIDAHYTYLSMGVNHEVTLAANRASFANFRLRPKRLVDVRAIDTTLELMGMKLASPIALAPIGSQAAYHKEAEMAVARAAQKMDHLQIVSMSASRPLDDITEARNGAVWAQIYGQRFMPATRHYLREAERAGCGAIVLTVDIVGLPTGRERIERYQRSQNPDCRSCHSSIAGSAGRAVASLADDLGFDIKTLAMRSMILDWGIVDRIRDATSLPLVIKGILTAEDAERCIEHGADAILVSNHGGRSEDSGFASIDALPQIVDSVKGRVPVLVDSGFRRGTDIFKALALGADAVCIGRPYIWGLAAFGEVGVVRVLEILRSEFAAIMRQMGTPTLADIDRAKIEPAP